MTSSEACSDPLRPLSTPQLPCSTALLGMPLLLPSSRLFRPGLMARLRAHIHAGFLCAGVGLLGPLPLSAHLYCLLTVVDTKSKVPLETILGGHGRVGVMDDDDDIRASVQALKKLDEASATDAASCAGTSSRHMRACHSIGIWGLLPCIQTAWYIGSAESLGIRIENLG